MKQYEVEVEGTVPVEDWEDVNSTFTIEAEDENDAREQAEDLFYDEQGFDADLTDVYVVELEDE